MTIEEVKAKIREVAASYFTPESVFFAEQKMSAKAVPMITLTFGDLTKTFHPIVENDSNPEERVMTWTVKSLLDIDVFTQGKPIGNNFKNTAVSDLQDFIYFLESDEIIDELSEYGITILPQTGVRNISELFNDTKFRYRANTQFMVVFTEATGGPYNSRYHVVPDSSGGGRQAYVDAETDYFTSVEIKEDKSQ